MNELTKEDYASYAIDIKRYVATKEKDKMTTSPTSNTSYSSKFEKLQNQSLADNVAQKTLAKNQGRKIFG